MPHSHVQKATKPIIKNTAIPANAASINNNVNKATCFITPFKNKNKE